MLTIQHIQEDLSRACIQAVAAKAGVNLSLGTHAHDYGVDGTFHQVEMATRVDAEGKPRTRRLNSGFNLEFQCKASRNWREQKDVIAYDLEVKTYNDLIHQFGTLFAGPDRVAQRIREDIAPKSPPTRLTRTPKRTPHTPPAWRTTKPSAR